MMFGAGFIADGVCHFLHQAGIPGGSQANGLRKNGGASVAGNPMQGFVPKVVGGNSQAGDGLRLITELAHFFSQGQAFQQILNAGFEGQVWVLVGQAGGGGNHGYSLLCAH